MLVYQTGQINMNREVSKDKTKRRGWWRRHKRGKLQGGIWVDRCEEESEVGDSTGIYERGGCKEESKGRGHWIGIWKERMVKRQIKGEYHEQESETRGRWRRIWLVRDDEEGYEKRGSENE
jgi:hypothetical protein